MSRSSSRAPSATPTRFTHVGISQFEELNRFVSAATVEVAMTARPTGSLTSEKRQHVDSFKRPTFEPSTEVGIRSGLREDLYIVFAGAVNGTEEAVYRFNINPLVWWVWAGGFILVFGGLITMWPGGGPTIAAPRRGAGRLRGGAGGRGDGVSVMARRESGAPAGRRAFLRRGFGAGGPPVAVQDPRAGQGAVGTLFNPRRGGPAARPPWRATTTPDPPSSCGWRAPAAARSTSSPAAPPTSPAPTRRRCIARWWRCARGRSARRSRRLRGQVRREDADGAQAGGLQPRGLPGAGRRHPRRGRRTRRLHFPAAGRRGGRRPPGRPWHPRPRAATTDELERLERALAEMEE